MTATTTPIAPETHVFQAEIRQLLDIVIHSLYTEREIFVRELISNAADASEKFRHEALTNDALPERDRTLEVRLTVDEEAKTFEIADAGIGMTREELTENLGTIAHSGTKKFLSTLAEGKKEDVRLIGQFGVGFYSAFMVAKKVVVETRSHHADSQGWRWESDGTGAYTIAPSEADFRGTRIRIELKDDAEEFAKSANVREIIRKFSNFVGFPIVLNGERVNTVEAIWAKSKSDVKDEEYTEFFKFIANAPGEPLLRQHFSADAPLSIQALLFVPADNMERLGFGRTQPGVDLYCRRVMIMKHPEGLLPEWMRFVRGVVDSEDLPLNISREMLQDNRLVRKLSNVIVGRFIKFLDEQSRTDADKFAKFYETHAFFLKEGVTQDAEHREALAKLLRWESSKTEGEKTTSLAEYVTRMKPEQKAIYYINGPSRAAIKAGPYLDPFRARDVEVIYLHEALDDFVMNHLNSFDGHRLISADSRDLELSPLDAKDQSEEMPAEAAAELCTWIKTALGDRIGEVRMGDRLVSNPAVAVADGFYSNAMQRVMMAVNRKEGDMRPFVALELNPRHDLVKRLNFLRVNDEPLARDLAEQVCDNALIAGGLLTDPRNLVERLNRLVARAAGLS